MRTTLTIDDDVAISLERLRSERGDSFKHVVNETLRLGLAALDQQPLRSRKAQRTRSVSLGTPRLPNIDNITEALAVAEGEGFR